MKNVPKIAHTNKFWIKQKKYLKQPDFVLDFGCATGLYSIKFASNVKTIIGIDISSKMIEIANRNALTPNIKNISFSQSTIFNEELKKESFNIILSFNIIHFLENTQEGIQRLNELLRPGGLIISSTACMGEKSLMNSFVFFLMKFGVFPRFRFFKKTELEEVFTQGGFTIIESKVLTYHPTIEYYIVAKKL
ncbi:MAG: class I SAM-dependent methyltransferase [Candidatus Syntrophoarchaeum sp.]|nr:class I SAM-dependent methyltransferase [Candidatus Syntrophoarchaeum sp.]